MKIFGHIVRIIAGIVSGLLLCSVLTYANTQTFDDGSSITTFDDGSTIVTDTE
jgi:hypothetical protein